MRITDTFKVEEIKGEREGRPLVKLLAPIEYRVGHANSNEVILVPANFVTDFASVPKGLWNVFPPMGSWSRAAVVHDYLYATHGYFGTYTRVEADKIFLEIMQVLDVPFWKRQLMFWAVRLGGKSGWTKDA